MTLYDKLQHLKRMQDLALFKWVCGSRRIDALRSYTTSRTWRRYLQGVIPVEEESELLEA